MEIGAQQLGSTCLLAPERLQRLGEVFDVREPLPIKQADPNCPAYDGSSQVLNSDAPFARELWQWLGFKYAAIDVDGSPGSVPLDLNFDSVPAEQKLKYDLVTNFGTTEHVINQLNAFKVIHDLTAPNGLMIHEVPAQGMFNHGLINYNPKFFWLLSRSNGYKFIHSDFMPSPDYSTLPDNVTKFLRTNSLAPLHAFDEYKVADAGIFVVMQKCYDIEFVPPIDVNTGTSTEIELLKKRYWTVFEQNVFDGPQYRAPSAQQSAESRTVHTWVGGVTMRPLRTLKRLVYNSDRMLQNSEHIEAIAKQSDVIHRKLGAIEAEVSNQSDMMSRKLDSLIKVMNELREIQKVQLATQRTAAEAIKSSITGKS